MEIRERNDHYKELVKQKQEENEGADSGQGQPPPLISHSRPPSGNRTNIDMPKYY
jgi:hypothetical protein